MGSACFKAEAYDGYGYKKIPTCHDRSLALRVTNEQEPDEYYLVEIRWESGTPKLCYWIPGQAGYVDWIDLRAIATFEGLKKLGTKS